MDIQEPKTPNTRILLFTGKGGVGKTTCAAATAIQAASQGYKTLILSSDPAHSLADALDIELGPEPQEVLPNLFAQEVDLYYSMKKYWGNVHIFAVVFNLLCVILGAEPRAHEAAISVSASNLTADCGWHQRALFDGIRLLWTIGHSIIKPKLSWNNILPFYRICAKLINIDKFLVQFL